MKMSIQSPIVSAKGSVLATEYRTCWRLLVTCEQREASDQPLRNVCNVRTLRLPAVSVLNKSGLCVSSGHTESRVHGITLQFETHHVRMVRSK